MDVANDLVSVPRVLKDVNHSSLSVASTAEGANQIRADIDQSDK